jgi:hypothetical protein
MKTVASFRTKHRLPVVVWKNPNAPNLLFRSSQPKVCKADAHSHMLIALFHP